MKKNILLFVISLFMVLVGCDLLAPQEPVVLPPAPTLIVETAVPTITTVAESSMAEVDSGGGEPGESEVTPEATATMTATVTVTVSAAAVGTPVVQPGIVTADPLNLPQASRDLLFLVDGRVQLWTAHDRQIQEILGDGITHMAVSDDGNRAVVARLIRQDLDRFDIEASDRAADGSVYQFTYTEHELLMIDLVNKESWVVEDNVVLLQDLSLSPNGQIVTFVAHSLMPWGDSPPVDLPEPFALHSGLFASSGVYLDGAQQGMEAELWRCAHVCSLPLWRDDSGLAIFSDQVGVYLYNINGTVPEALINLDPAFFPPTNPPFTPLEWGRDGRTVLLNVWDNNGDRRFMVFDLPTKNQFQIPNRIGTPGRPMLSSVDWLSDGRLLLLHSLLPNDGNSDGETSLGLWRYQVDENESLQLDEDVDLWLDSSVQGQSAVHLEDGRFAYALRHATDVEVAGLYIRTSFATEPERVSGLPIGLGPLDVLWSADGRGAMVTSDHGIYYAENEGQYIDMTTVFGGVPLEMSWLRPSDATR